MKWISLENEKPDSCVEIIFTDGKKVYFGWLETYEPLEELNFLDACDRYVTIEGVSHWMKKPSVPKFPGIEISRERKCE